MGLILPETQKTDISDERWWWEAMAAEECPGGSCGRRPSGRRAREEVGECEDDFCRYHATPCVYAGITSSSCGRIYWMVGARPARGDLSHGGGSAGDRLISGADGPMRTGRYKARGGRDDGGGDSLVRRRARERDGGLV